MPIWILRTLASLLCSFLIVCAITSFFATLAIASIAEPAIYADALTGQRAYDRLHSEVLVPSLTLESGIGNVPGLAMLPPDDTLNLIRELAPPAYLQEQAEGNLSRLSEFAAGDSGQLDLYLELSGPLERLPLAIDELAMEKLTDAHSPAVLSALNIHAEAIAAGVEGEGKPMNLADTLESMLDGENPSQAAAEYTGLTREELLAIVDEAVDKALADPLVPQEFRVSLNEARTPLRDAFAHGSTREFLGEAFKAVAGLGINEALARQGLELDSRKRLHLRTWLEHQIPGFNDARFEKTAARWRDGFQETIFRGRIAAVTVLLTSIVLLVLVHWRRTRNLVLWTGWTLAISGAFLLATTFLALWQGPGMAHRAVDQWLVEALPLSPGLALLSADVAGQALNNLLATLIWPAALPLVAGGLLLAALMGWERSRSK